MCGRFTLTTTPQDLQTAFSWLSIPPDAVSPRYNIAPTQPIAVVANNGQKSLDYFIWGLIPSWAKDPGIGNRMINARAETLAEKPAYRSAFRRRRCLILADGFYEWKAIPGKKSKQPMYIHLKSGQPYAFGGLWEIWNSPDGSIVYSCTIITTEPNTLMAEIHNRMPLILPEDSYEQWLSTGDFQANELAPLLQPFPADQMTAYPVSPLVNNPANDVPACVEMVLPS